MMIRLLLAAVSALGLSACTSATTSTSPSEQARKAETASLERAVWQTRTTVSVDGKAVEVAVAPDKTFALVDVRDFGAVFTLPQMERAARQASGCDGIHRSKLEKLSDDETFRIKTASVQTIPYFSVQLNCK